MLLRELHERRVVDEAGDGWVFVSPVYPGYPIDATSLAKAYQRIWPEYPITAHGFRATYRTISHAIWASIRLYWSCFTACRACWALFTRAQLQPQRSEAAQQWTNYLDGLRKNAALAGQT